MRTSESGQPAPSRKTVYTCPMHPDVVKDEPRDCPICGMALEPRTPALDQQEDPELKSMTRRFWVSVALTIPLLVLAMGDMIPGVRFRVWLVASIENAS